jgi:CheY-like chemotaxis protein
MNTKVILLVDSEVLVRETIEICLQYLAGWQVRAVASGREGLQIAATEALDAIVLALNSIDGLIFLQKLRANSVTHSIPVVLLTEKAKWFTSSQLKQFAIAGALDNPFMPLTLPHQIANFLGWN